MKAYGFFSRETGFNLLTIIAVVLGLAVAVSTGGVAYGEYIVSMSSETESGYLQDKKDVWVRAKMVAYDGEKLFLLIRKTRETVPYFRCKARIDVYVGDSNDSVNTFHIFSSDNPPTQCTLRYPDAEGIGNWQTQRTMHDTTAVPGVTVPRHGNQPIEG